MSDLYSFVLVIFFAGIIEMPKRFGYYSANNYKPPIGMKILLCLGGLLVLGFPSAFIGYYFMKYTPSYLWWLSVLVGLVLSCSLIYYMDRAEKRDRKIYELLSRLPSMQCGSMLKCESDLDCAILLRKDVEVFSDGEFLCVGRVNKHFNIWVLVNGHKLVKDKHEFRVL